MNVLVVTANYDQSYDSGGPSDSDYSYTPPVPFGVKAISLLMGLSAVGTLLLGLLVFLANPIVGTLLLGYAVITLFLARGLWEMDSDAYVWTMVLHAVSTVISLFTQRYIAVVVGLAILGYLVTKRDANWQ